MLMLKGRTEEFHLQYSRNIVYHMPIIYTYSYGFGATEKNNSSSLCCFAFSQKKT